MSASAKQLKLCGRELKAASCMEFPSAIICPVYVGQMVFCVLCTWDQFLCIDQRLSWLSISHLQHSGEHLADRGNHAATAPPPHLTSLHPIDSFKYKIGVIYWLAYRADPTSKFSLSFQQSMRHPINGGKQSRWIAWVWAWWLQCSHPLNLDRE